MQAQDIINQVTEHLFKQKIASVAVIEGYGETCAYRGINGTMCAIGCLIHDDEYVPTMEGKGVNNLQELLPARFEEHLNLLDRLQEAHDRDMPRYKLEGASEEWDQMLHAMDMKKVTGQIQDIAKSFGLEFPKHLIPEQYHVN